MVLNLFFEGISAGLKSFKEISDIINKSVSTIFLSLTGETSIIIEKIIKNTAVKLNLVEENVNLEELGNKVLQASENGIKRYKFENFEDYKKKVNLFEVDEEKSQILGKNQKRLAAISFIIEEITYKYELNFIEFIKIILKNPVFYNTDRTVAYIKEFSKAKEDISKLKDYLEGSLNEVKKIKIQEIIKSAEDFIKNNISKENEIKTEE